MTPQKNALVAEKFSISWIPPLVAYCFASILMTVTNRIAFSGFPLKIPFFVLSVQCGICVLLIELLSLFRAIKFQRPNFKSTIAWLPVAFSFAMMLFTAAKSLEHLSIAVFTIFKNLSIVIIAVAEKIMVPGTRITILMALSFIIMIASASVAAVGENVYSSTKIKTDPIGYLWVLLNCITSAFYILHMRRVIKTLSFMDFDTMYHGNILATPFFIILSLCLDPRVSSSPDPWLFVALVIGSGFAGFAISFASSWAMRVVNSTTYSVAGALNKLPVSLAGLIFLNEPATIFSISSIILGFSAGVLYTFAKVTQDLVQKTRENAKVTDIPSEKLNVVSVNKN